MLCKKMLAVASATLMMLAGAASAETLTFQYTGTVTYTRDSAFAPVGSHIQGSFSYDENTAGSIVTDGQATYQPASFMSATINGHTIISDRLGVDVFDNQGGNVEDMAVVSGFPILVDDALFVDGSFGLSLASGPGSTGELQGSG